MAKAVRNTKFLRAVVMKLFFVFSNINNNQVLHIFKFI